MKELEKDFAEKCDAKIQQAIKKENSADEKTKALEELQELFQDTKYNDLDLLTIKVMGNLHLSGVLAVCFSDDELEKLIPSLTSLKGQKPLEGQNQRVEGASVLLKDLCKKNYSKSVEKLVDSAQLDDSKETINLIFEFFISNSDFDKANKIFEAYPTQVKDFLSSDASMLLTKIPEKDYLYLRLEFMPMLTAMVSKCDLSKTKDIGNHHALHFACKYGDNELVKSFIHNLSNGVNYKLFENRSLESILTLVFNCSKEVQTLVLHKMLFDTKTCHFYELQDFVKEFNQYIKEKLNFGRDITIEELRDPTQYETLKLELQKLGSTDANKALHMLDMSVKATTKHGIKEVLTARKQEDISKFQDIKDILDSKVPQKVATKAKQHIEKAQRSLNELTLESKFHLNNICDIEKHFLFNLKESMISLNSPDRLHCSEIFTEALKALGDNWGNDNF